MRARKAAADVMPRVYYIADLLTVFACDRSRLEKLRKTPGFPRPMEAPGDPMWSRVEIDDWCASRQARLDALKPQRMAS